MTSGRRTPFCVLRLRIEHVESKFRVVIVVRALEQRKEQIRQWSRMYDALQTEFAEAQETANTQPAFVAEQNETIERLTEMIDHLGEMSRVAETKGSMKAEVW